jgi:hypothetical protein
MMPSARARGIERGGVNFTKRTKLGEFTPPRRARNTESTRRSSLRADPPPPGEGGTESVAAMCHYRVAGAGAFFNMLCAPALISAVSPGA